MREPGNATVHDRATLAQILVNFACLAMVRPLLTRPRMRTTPLLSSIALLSLAGCATITGEDDVDGAGGKGDQIDPTDSEDLATLIVRLPPNLPGSPPLEPFELHVNDMKIDSDVEVRLLAGEKRLVLSASTGGSLDTMVTLVAGQTTTIDLAAAFFHWDTSPSSPFNVTVGYPPSMDVSWDDDDRFLLVDPVTTLRALLPGTYSAKGLHPALQPVSVTALPGIVHDFDLTPPDTRASIVVHPPQRAFPPPNAYGCSQLRLVETTHAPHEPHDVSADPPPPTDSVTIVKLPENDVTTAKVLPFPSTDVTQHELVVSNISTPLALVPNQTLDFYVKRIDVNDVRITRENGTTYLVQGTWKVERKVGPSPTAWEPVKPTPCNGPFPTKSGIDVPPGTYRVTINYETGEGPEQQEHVLTL
ncbi:MAG: hypothetical protein AB7T06_37790 [Kofleriaceae bacterium]